MAIVAFLGARAYGIDLGDLLKVGGIGYVVRQSGGAINKAINTVTLNRGVKNEQMTKVVPVLSFGQGGYIGAVQVSGPPQLVKKVEGVAQLETGLSAFGNSVRARILVPIDTNDARKGFHRVQGVGVSALVDLRI
jgi:hypothetical protein